MKNLTIILLLVISPVFLNAQDFVDNMIQKYQGKSGFTTVIINKNLFDIAIALDADNDLEKMKGMIDNIRIIAMEGKSDQNINFFNEINSQVNIDSYKELMKVKQSDEDVVFYVKYNSNNNIEELLLIAGGNNENAVISLKGNINLKDVAQLSRSMHISGFEHMEKLKDVN